MFKPYKYVKKEKHSLPLHTYIKYKSSEDRPSFNIITSRNAKPKAFHPKNLVSIAMIISGIYMMIFRVIVPVAAMKLDTNTKIPIISPVSDDVGSIEQQLSGNKDGFKFSELSNGFDTKQATNNDSAPEFFYISIPKLGIKEAKVESNPLNLNPEKAIGRYKGSCLPGDACNTFLFGHSTFKYVKNNYENGDYTSIFSKLDELNYGDEFSIKFEDKTYRYLINTTKVDKPQNINPLKNPFSQGVNRSSVTLMTCSPPGSTENRLEVIGVLVN